MEVEAPETRRGTIESLVAARRRPVPDWARAPLDLWRARTSDAVNLVDLAATGIARLRGMPDLIEALDAGQPPLTAVENEAESAAGRAEKLAAAKKQAETAEEEVKNDFPLLHALACVWLWVSLETLLDDLMVAVLRNDAAAAGSEEVRDVKVPLAVAVATDRDVLARAVYQELELKRGAAFKQGVSRFEGMLSLVGLGGPVPEDLRRVIFEVGNVRNVVLHRGGVVDEAFASACPWLGVASGETFHVGHRRYIGYVMAVLQYVGLIWNRVADRYPALTNLAPGEQQEQPSGEVAQKKRRRVAPELVKGRRERAPRTGDEAGGRKPRRLD